MTPEYEFDACQWVISYWREKAMAMADEAAKLRADIGALNYDIEVLQNRINDQEKDVLAIAAAYNAAMEANRNWEARYDQYEALMGEAAEALRNAHEAQVAAYDQN